MSTPAYVAPYISPTAGLVIPTYASILADLISQYLSIYPQVVYLNPTQAKYQELSIISLKIFDSMLASQLAYNARSPLTAVGSDLDSIVKLNGLARKAAGYSIAPETITGISGTVITNGMVTDTSGNIWALPVSVTIPSGGSVTVSIECQTPGAIQAAAGAINIISGGATAGWTGATNPSAAVVGLPVETDSQLRARQSLSVAAPSSTRLAGTLAGIAAVPDVTRYNTGTLSADGTTLSIENPTGAVDSFGNPAHSVSMVVEGGTDIDVATAIFANRGIGPYTNPNATNNPTGTRSIPVTDPNTGNVTLIGFQRPDYVPIFVTMQIHGLAGYTTAVLASVHDAIVLYLNSLQIGETLTFSSLYSVALDSDALHRNSRESDWNNRHRNSILPSRSGYFCKRHRDGGLRRCLFITNPGTVQASTASPTLAQSTFSPSATTSDFLRLNTSSLRT
jgi:hypothetical protein